MRMTAPKVFILNIAGKGMDTLVVDLRDGYKILIVDLRGGHEIVTDMRLPTKGRRIVRRGAGENMSKGISYPKV
jgi:hypothetical protein